MRLVPCPRPTGTLDPAPLTALCGAPDAEAAASGGVAYEAFWGEDDGYYLRQTVDGEASWLAGRADVGEASSAGAPERVRRSGTHAAVPAAAAGDGRGRLRVMLVGRQHGRRRSRVPMHLCVTRVRPSP
jgi:hypothetical protein